MLNPISNSNFRPTPLTQQLNSNDDSNKQSMQYNNSSVQSLNFAQQRLEEVRQANPFIQKIGHFVQKVTDGLYNGNLSIFV